MKLNTRLSMIVLSVSLTITILSLYVVRQEVNAQQLKSQQIFVKTFIQAMADTLITDVINKDKAKLTKTLQMIQRRDDNPIEYLYITDMQGQVFAHSYPNDFPDYLNQKLSKYSSLSTNFNEVRLVTEHNIKESGLIHVYNIHLVSDLPAQLVIGLNQTYLQRVLNETSKTVLILGVILSLLCTCLAWFATRYVIRPIEQLAFTLTQYKSGDNIDLLHSKHDAVDIQLLKSSLQQVFNARDNYEQLLQTREQDLDITLSSIGDAVIATDKNGNVTRMNPVAQALTGWTIEEALGKSVKTIFPIINESTREPIPNPVEKVLVTGNTVYLSNHTTLISKEGTEYQIADSAAPIRNENNDVVGMVLVFNDVTEQYKLRQESQTAQQQMQKTFDDMQTMVVVLDDNAKVIFTNNLSVKVSNIEKSDVMGKKLWECVWFNYDVAVQTIIKDKCKQTFQGESTLHDIQIMTDEGLLWIEFSLHPVRNDDGAIFQLVAEGRDVSERKRLEKEMYDSLQQLELYREQTPLAAIEWNTDFQVVNWNSAAGKMFGYSLDEVKGRNFVDIMLPESAVVDVKQIWQSLMTQTGGITSTNENITKDGKTILCEWHNTPLITDSGEVVGAASLVLDITNEHAAQQALEQKEQEQREILSALSESVLTVDETGIMQTFNHAAESLSGLSATEAIGQNIAIFISELSKSNQDGYLERYIHSGQMRHLVGSRETIIKNINNKTFPILLNVAELPLSDVTKCRYVISCQDLTQIKSQQAQLQRAQKMDSLGKLVGGIAHDYNNMLGVILGYTSLMEMKFSNIDGLPKYISNISQAGERGRQLTKRLLSFSKQESTEAKPVDINMVLDHQKDLLSKSLTAIIDINYQLCNTSWLIWVDQSELEDALLNVAINAKYAMPEGGKLTLSTHEIQLSQTEARQMGLSENDYISLSITDTGCGIEKDIVDSIFDPFFSTKGTDGTGLGLSQVYSFVKRAGGTIKVYSQKGKGSEFTFYFPRYLTNELNVTQIDEITSYRQGDGQTILVVDDEPALRELAQEILTLAGYRVLMANDGDDAIKVLAKSRVDLVLSDVIMPQVDGYQLAQYIQKNYPAIKIQLASGFSDNRHLTMTNTHLHDTMLHKPYKSSALLSRISTLIYGDIND